MYYLLDGPERAFVSEKLMLIPEDAELPPDYVRNGRGYHLWLPLRATTEYLSRWIDISYELFLSFQPY